MCKLATIAVLILGLIYLNYIEANSTSLKIVNCKSVGKTSATVKKIEITECKTFPCILKRGSKYSIKVEFQTQQKLTDLKLNIMGLINGKSVPFSTNDDNHCLETIKELKDQKKCVLNRKNTYNYEFSLNVLNTYPAIQVYVNYMLKSNDKPVFCFTFPAKLV